jgi:hypothetical protein
MARLCNRIGVYYDTGVNVPNKAQIGESAVVLWRVYLRALAPSPQRRTVPLRDHFSH